MDLLNIFYENISTIIVTIGGGLAWFFERKKRKTEMQLAEASAEHSVMDLYQEALDDLKKRYDEKFEELEEEIKSLRTNMEYWKTKYKNLKRQFFSSISKSLNHFNDRIKSFF